MKNVFASWFFFWVVLFAIDAQSFSGEYFITAAEGEIVLKLEENGQNQLSGLLVDMNNVQYQVKGTFEATDASGIISNPQGGLFFEAYLEGQQLILTLMPPAANQQPDYTKAQEFPLMRRGNTTPGTSSPIRPPLANRNDKVSGPLGSGGNTEQNWTGSYSGNINGTPATLSLQQNGNQVNGIIDASGYKYSLSGTANGKNAQGQVIDTQTQGGMTYQSTLNGTDIAMTISVNGSQLQLQFSKSTTNDSKVAPSAGNTGKTNNVQLDQRLVGNWLYTESYSSDGFSFASQWRMIVNADGTYLYGDAKVAGGGDGVSGSSGGGGMTPGKWKTENSIIYIDEGYGWQPYAKYYVEGYSLMLTFGDGKRQVWKK